jgi:hypothetical protein
MSDPEEVPIEMPERKDSLNVEGLEALIGVWSMAAAFPGAPPSDLRGRTVFDWMSGKKFVVQRWEVPHPDAPDGIAIIGVDRAAQKYMQHYFDSRGVARVYGMSFADGVWELWRTTPDLSPLDFPQRFKGTLSAAGDVIEGRWEIARDGSTWEHDFELTYTRVP